jgi:hypothetical protein
MSEINREVILNNGMKLEFKVDTRRYFGDYNKINIELSCKILITEEMFDSKKLYEQVKDYLGSIIEYRRNLSQMGVGTEQCELVVNDLIECFIKNSTSYLLSRNFPIKLIASNLKNNRQLSLYGKVCSQLHA